MPADTRFPGWRAIVLVAATYVYFLLFAQFAFLARLAQFGLAPDALPPVLACMALAGILSSFLAARLVPHLPPAPLLRAGLLLCALAAAGSLAPFPAAAAPLALLIGAGLGLLTVPLVAHLPLWCSTRRPLLSVGLGTGLGYALCNIPALFCAAPRTQALAAALFCLAALPAAANSPAIPAPQPPPAPAEPFPLILAAFAALVWLDSAAFYVIQHAPDLKAASWSGSAQLLFIAAVHFLAALAAALLLARRQAALVLAAAVAALAAACLLLAHPGAPAAAALFYPAGVSLYSTALVAWPAFFSPGSLRQRARRAAWLYAVAGWIASALGIGMARHLGHVPPAFLLAAALLVSLPALRLLLRTRRRETLLLAAVALLAFLVRSPRPPAEPASSAQRGRLVYISQGCISCHSQYVRPGSPDPLLWGPASSPSLVRAQQPPLIGNRRQGPDLAQVGRRRSPLWLRIHLLDPAALSPGSPMPSYAFLFRDRRGPDLVDYLAGLQSPGPDPAPLQQAWHLDPAALAAASPAEGRRLYLRFCSTCHDPAGAALLRWGSSFPRLPPDLRALAAAAQAPHSQDRLAHTLRFGLPGTSMPGHEYLSDRQIASLLLWLTQNPQTPSGDTP